MSTKGWGGNVILKALSCDIIITVRINCGIILYNGVLCNTVYINRGITSHNFMRPSTLRYK